MFILLWWPQKWLHWWKKRIATCAQAFSYPTYVDVISIQLTDFEVILFRSTQYPTRCEVSSIVGGQNENKKGERAHKSRTSSAMNFNRAKNKPPLLVTNQVGWLAFLNVTVDASALLQTKHQVQSRFLLDVVVSKRAAVFQLLTSKDQTLLVRGYAFLVLDLLLDVLDGVLPVMVLPVRVLTKICIDMSFLFGVLEVGIFVSCLGWYGKAKLDDVAGLISLESTNENRWHHNT